MLSRQDYHLQSVDHRSGTVHWNLSYSTVTQLQPGATAPRPLASADVHVDGARVAALTDDGQWNVDLDAPVASVLEGSAAPAGAALAVVDYQGTPFVRPVAAQAVRDGQTDSTAVAVAERRGEEFDGLQCPWASLEAIPGFLPLPPREDKVVPAPPRGAVPYWTWAVVCVGAGTVAVVLTRRRPVNAVKVVNGDKAKKKRAKKKSAEVGLLHVCLHNMTRSSQAAKAAPPPSSPSTSPSAAVTDPPPTPQQPVLATAVQPRETLPGGGLRVGHIAMTDTVLGFGSGGTIVYEGKFNGTNTLPVRMRR